jgi:hypothetical protein
VCLNLITSELYEVKEDVIELFCWQIKFCNRYQIIHFVCFVPGSATSGTLGTGTIGSTAMLTGTTVSAGTTSMFDYALVTRGEGVGKLFC